MGSSIKAWMVPQHKQPNGYEAALIDAGFLTPVLAKHRKVFNVGEECVTLDGENRTFLQSETHDLNDEEVRNAQEREFPEEYQLSSDS